jgi:hypothetical protein
MILTILDSKKIEYRAELFTTHDALESASRDANSPQPAVLRHCRKNPDY